MKEHCVKCSNIVSNRKNKTEKSKCAQACEKTVNRTLADIKEIKLLKLENILVLIHSRFELSTQ